MNAQKLILAVVFLSCVSACDQFGLCKVGHEAADCPLGTFCYGGLHPKAGDMGVCTRKAAVSAVELVEGPAGESEAGEPGKPEEATPELRPLRISGFSPPMAPHGATLHIYGENFSAVASENSIRLAGFQVPADSIVWVTETEITLVVPQNTRCTGPLQICTGPVQVLVNDKAATSVASFTYVPTVVVSTFAGSGPTGKENGGWRDGSKQTARLNEPRGVVVGLENHLYVTDYENHRIRKISPEGEVSTFAGSAIGYRNASGTNARFDHPTGIALNAALGNLYVVDACNGYIRQITPLGNVTTFAGTGGQCSNDNLACFAKPSGMALDAKTGNLYMADTLHHRILRVTPLGVVEHFAGSSTGAQGYADATGAHAQFYMPDGMALDAAGNLYVADYANHCIRKISPAGVVTTFAGECTQSGFADGFASFARFTHPSGIAVDARTGTLYISDYARHLIRKITPEGMVSTLAGNVSAGCGLKEGLGALAQFCYPAGIAIDEEGNLYVADTLNHRIRKIVFE